ncbi:hypothetical protein C3B64_01500 [Clostridium botulinum]|uniref:Bacteriocin n=2 Tax=Clostridium TaxID=1485 RepID=A0AAU8YT68_CLOBO|nr:hypothetical protein [Clostridium sporogenes]AVP62997.1 hypothetical protein C3B64_01500 [Clostridium botulinum]AKC60910.1 hypothetical protein CLSPO_c01730 [Clostridium sporogenes]AKJ88267.1 hypothetical protein CLSPOx_00865 [Clostridium sporogenes]KCZ70178.1 bacteriocin class II [Clostridium sporogenes]MCF4018284.1 hypothetical protein [Clostridium sporogenes]
MEQISLMELENINGGVNWDAVGCSIAAGGGGYIGAKIGASVGTAGGPVGTVVGGIVGGAVGTIIYTAWD